MPWFICYIWNWDWDKVWKEVFIIYAKLSMKVSVSVVKVKSPELKIMTWKMLFGQICVKTLKNLFLFWFWRYKHHQIFSFFGQKLDPGILTKGTWPLKKVRNCLPRPSKPTQHILSLTYGSKKFFFIQPLEKF